MVEPKQDPIGDPIPFSENLVHAGQEQASEEQLFTQESIEDRGKGE